MRRVVSFTVHNCELQTPCPHGCMSEDGSTAMVNSFGCWRCRHFGGTHRDYGKIYCTHK